MKTLNQWSAISLTMIALGLFTPVLSQADLQIRSNAADLKRQSFQLRVVQTLIDTEKGFRSKGKIKARRSDIESHLRTDKVGVTSFTRLTREDPKTPEAEYRFTIGNVSAAYLQRQWWRRVQSEADGSAPEVWVRRVSDFGGEYLDFLARRHAQGYLFEVRILSKGLEEGRRQVVQRLNLFLDNAYASRIFDKKAPPLTQNLSSSPFTGKWVGPMHNSKGGKASGSTLIVRERPNGEISGTWHAGWKFSKALKIGQTLFWEHQNIGKGCRDYQVEFSPSADGKKANLLYVVTDRCNSPSKYSGEATLTRQ